MKLDQLGYGLEKALITGGITAVAGELVKGRGGNVFIPIINRSVPLWTISLMSGVLSSLSTDLLHSFVKEEIHLAKKAEDEASMVMGAVIGGFMFKHALGLARMELPDAYGCYTAYAVGGGAEIAGSFVYNMIRG